MTCRKCKTLGLDEDCGTCGESLNLLTVNRIAFEAWQTLNAWVLLNKGAYSVGDTVATLQALGGTEKDLFRVLLIETVYRGLQ